MKRRYSKTVLFSLFLLVLMQRPITAAAADPVQNTDPAQNTDSPKTAEEYLETMTLEEKIAQMFVITPEALMGEGTVTNVDGTFQESLKAHPVSGLIYFSKNLQSEEQVRQMLQTTMEAGQNVNGLPLFQGVDEEGGDVTRIYKSGILEIEDVGSMAAIGATNDPQKAREAGAILGSYLGDLGFNLDFAPVADVLTNPDNLVVRTRSFGSDPELVCSMVCQELEGLKSQGVYGTLKHFPGHGATRQDSHTGYASTDRTLEQIKTEELLPFQAGINAGASFVMAGHISAPEITGNDIPASLSQEMITEILREDMGYDKIVITDALNMGAISQKYGSGEAAILSVEAGADILLMPADFEAASHRLTEAVRSGRIPESRIDQSVLRILRVKMELQKNME